MNQDKVLSCNRAEEFGEEAWRHFVLPPNFDHLDIKRAKKTRVITGGRGSGKTMLLRYLSYVSEFAKEHERISANAIEHIGLYWRADTHFCSSFKALGKNEDYWKKAFDHFLAITVSLELLKSLRSISDSRCESLSPEDLLSLDFSRLSGFDPAIPNKFNLLFDYFDLKNIELLAWITNMLEGARPVFLPGFIFVNKLIELVKAQKPTFDKACFYLYVDEYENLLDYQQKALKDYIKHGAAPLIAHFAMKRFALSNRATSSGEDIQEIHDFRYIDIEDNIDDDIFKCFAAEILLSELASAGIIESVVDKKILTRPEAISLRSDKKYKDNILSHAKSIFPELTHKELAELVLSDSTIRDKLALRIRAILKESKQESIFDKIFDLQCPEAVLILPTLLSRKGYTPDLLVKLISEYRENKSDKFYDLIHNNLVGSILLLYQTHNKTCPLYSGFGTICKLSHLNLRFFLEICYKAIEFHRFEGNADTKNIPPITQAKGAIKASGRFLEEIKGSGPKGILLHRFVQRLGSIFQLAHRRPSLSENEQNHFSITTGKSELSSEAKEFIIEAVKYNVLIDYPANKIKSETQCHDEDLRLNPIYAPYFKISYRKKRKLEISSESFHIFYDGSSDEFNALVSDYSKKWNISESGNLELFE